MFCDNTFCGNNNAKVINILDIIVIYYYKST